MLEIVFLRWFFSRLASMAEDKGRSKAWGALGVVLWFSAEIAGLVVGFASGGEELGAYAFAIGAALVSAVISYGIVASLSDVRQLDPAPLQF